MIEKLVRILAVTAATLTAVTASSTVAQSPQGTAWKYYPTPRQAPQGAPNILVIVTDDVGFGAASGAGGPVPTPAFDGLAHDGLLYNRFHTTAMCSPTRAALLTGRNHHAVGYGAISDLSKDEPGYTSVIPASAATVAKVLNENGYSTAWLGKNHNTPKWEETADGPFDHWPNAMGFDYFYGFNGGFTNQFFPELIENRNLIDPPRQTGYILDRDLADHAIAWLRRQHNLTPAKPFMLYYAPGTAHAPLQAPADWIARFKGKFDRGWDVQRQQTFARQKALGIIPANAQLTPRPKQIPAWDSLTPDQKKVAAREMEVFAAALAYSDDQIGRVLAELRRTGQIDNTLIFFLQGDNGAAAENMASAFNQYATFSGLDEGGQAIAHIDEIGGPNSFPAYPVGWAWAMDTPFQWSKQVASHFGGTRNALAVYWPSGIHTHGLRSQFHHVIDIVPTIYQVTGIAPPETVDGVKQMPLDGVSMVYSFANPKAPSTHHSQYFEMLGNRAFYRDGWIAATTPKRMPWEASAPKGQEHTPYRWELYNVDADYSEADNLAAKYPQKLKSLQEAFEEAALKYHVEPIDDEFVPRFNSALRPSPLQGRREFVYYPSGQRIAAAAFPALTRNWRAVASIRIDEANSSGPIVANGSKFSGWSLYLLQGTPMLTYRATDEAADWIVLTGAASLSNGPHLLTVAVSSRNAQGFSGLSLNVDGKTVATHRLDRLVHANLVSYVGRAPIAPLIENDKVPTRFTGGRIDSVAVTLLPKTP